MAEATSTALDVSDGVSLGIDYVTKTAAILAQRRKGKTYLGCDIAEELCYAKMPWVALDPTGAWWGLRSSADGQHEGLGVVVIGGQHGDLPLERESGAFVADLVLDHPGWYVLDLSLLESRAAEREFSAQFGARLHRRKMQPGMDFPLHLFVDEADLFVPQEKETTWNSSRSRVPDVLAVYSGIVRRGGLHGLGSTLISQRPALVNKNVLTQIDVLFLLRLVAGQDQDAVFKNNVSRFLPKQEALDLMATLATMPIGQGWVLEPGADPPLCERVQFRVRHTFNSSATPKPGETRVEPTVFADVDLDELRDRMAESIERVKQDDPAELRKRIRELERAHVMEVDVETRIETVFEKVEVPVVSRSDLDAASELILEAKRVGDQMAQTGQDVAEAVTAACRPLAEAILAAVEAAKSSGRESSAAVVDGARQSPRRHETVGERQGRQPAPIQNDHDELGTSARRVLETIARHHPVRLTPGQVAQLSGRKARGGSWNTAIATLRRAGLLEDDGATYAATDEGLAAAGVPSTGLSLSDWREALPGPARELLDLLVEADRPLDREELAARAGRQPRGGSWNTAVATLVRNGLVVRDDRGLRVAEALA